MSMTITQHGKMRLVERNDKVDNYEAAKRNAKIAFNSGYCIHQLAEHCPRTADWMRCKKEKNGRTARVRLYQNNLYLWRGTHKNFITAIPLPKILRKEVESYELSQR